MIPPTQESPSNNPILNKNLPAFTKSPNNQNSDTSASENTGMGQYSESFSKTLDSLKSMASLKNNDNHQSNIESIHQLLNLSKNNKTEQQKNPSKNESDYDDDSDNAGIAENPDSESEPVDVCETSPKGKDLSLRASAKLQQANKQKEFFAENDNELEINQPEQKGKVQNQIEPVETKLEQTNHNLAETSKCLTSSAVDVSTTKNTNFGFSTPNSTAAAPPQNNNQMNGIIQALHGGFL